MDLYDFCQILPKIELHAHLNGSLSKETLIVLNTPKESIETYQLKNVDLNTVFALFKVAHDATNTIESVYTATKHVIEEYHKDNVIYLELRSTPRKEKNMTKKQYIESILKAIKDQDLISVKLLLSINRTHSLKESEDTLNIIIEMYQIYPDIIKGVDFSGDPKYGDFHEKLCETAREHNLKITLHCAELKNDFEVERMLQFKPDRIGHGTRIHPNYGGSIDNWELYKKLKIPLECCLTSNVLCETVNSYKEHHIKEWITNNLPFSINTDDKGVFSTTLSKEYFYAAENLNLSKESLFNCSMAAVDYSFASNEEKLKLKNHLLEWKKQYLEIP